MSRLPLLALSALGLGLSGIVAAELVLPSADEDTSADIRPAPRLPRVGAAKPAMAIDDRAEAWVRTILARPLFTRDRRPADAPAAAKDTAVSDTLPRLTGIAVSPFGRRAIFAGADGGKPLVISEGDSVGPYTVRAIEPGAVRLAGPGGDKTVAPAFDPTPHPDTGLAAAGTPDQAQGQPPLPGLPQGFGQNGVPIPGRQGAFPTFRPPPFQPPGLRPHNGDGA